MKLSLLLLISLHPRLPYLLIRLEIVCNWLITTIVLSLSVRLCVRDVHFVDLRKTFHQRPRIWILITDLIRLLFDIEHKVVVLLLDDVDCLLSGAVLLQLLGRSQLLLDCLALIEGALSMIELVTIVGIGLLTARIVVFKSEAKLCVLGVLEFSGIFLI